MGTTKKRTASRKRKGVKPKRNVEVRMLPDGTQIATMDSIDDLNFMHRMAVSAAVNGLKLKFETHAPFDTLRFLDGKKADAVLGTLPDNERPNFWGQAEGSLLDVIGFDKERFDFSKEYYEGSLAHILQKLDVCVRWGVKASFGLFECPTREHLDATRDFKTEDELLAYVTERDLNSGIVDFEMKLDPMPLWVRTIENGIPVVNIDGQQYDEDGNYLPLTIMDYVYDTMRSEIASNDFDGYELYCLKIELTVLGV